MAKVDFVLSRMDYFGNSLTYYLKTLLNCNLKLQKSKFLTF